MKAVILAGGLGTRISEETSVRPKPMVEIGGKPILWHIIKTYSHYGINDFVICLGYKGEIIKNYFHNYYLLMSDVTFDMQHNTVTYHQTNSEPWRITLVNTGEDSMTGGRIKRIRDYVKDDDCFCLTYGDGLADINIAESIEYHRSHGKLATVSGYQSIGRFGLLEMKNDRVASFREKPKDEGGYINIGYFVLSPKIFDYIEGDATIWEKEPLQNLAEESNLMAYRHKGYWHAVDTLRDLTVAQELWTTGKAPWKTW